MPNKTKYDVNSIIGKKFGRLYITGPEEVIKNEKGKSVRYVYADCDCGNKHILVNVIRVCVGMSKSCGCLQSEQSKRLGEMRHSGEIQSRGNTSHGDSKKDSPYYKLYSSWSNMRSRCKYECCPNYDWYGGKGIKVCTEWDQEYIKFKEWALKNGWKPGLEIDRLDNDKNYEPDNCKWSTRKEQNNNSSHNVRINLYGMDLSMTQWAEQIGVQPKTLAAKIYRGKTPEEAVNSYINPNPDIKKPFIFINKK